MAVLGSHDTTGKGQVRKVSKLLLVEVTDLGILPTLRATYGVEGAYEIRESPEIMLARCAALLGCEPRQVYDRLLERLKDAKAKQAETPAK
jgi:hypothetical protein